MRFGRSVPEWVGGSVNVYPAGICGIGCLLKGAISVRELRGMWRTQNLVVSARDTNNANVYFDLPNFLP